MRNDLQEAYEIYEPNSDTGNYSDLAEQAGRDFADVYDNYSYYYLISACTDTSVAGWSDPIPYRDGSGKVHIVLGNTSSKAFMYPLKRRRLPFISIFQPIRGNMTIRPQSQQEI